MVGGWGWDRTGGRTGLVHGLHEGLDELEFQNLQVVSSVCFPICKMGVRKFLSYRWRESPYLSGSWLPLPMDGNDSAPCEVSPTQECSCLLNTSKYVSGQVLSTLPWTSYFLFMKTQWNRHFSCPHLTCKETKAQNRRVGKRPGFTQLVMNAGGIWAWPPGPIALRVDHLITSRQKRSLGCSHSFCKVCSYFARRPQRAFDCLTTWEPEQEWNAVCGDPPRVSWKGVIFLLCLYCRGQQTFSVRGCKKNSLD